jgi:hypothetical protein
MRLNNDILTTTSATCTFSYSKHLNMRPCVYANMSQSIMNPFTLHVDTLKNALTPFH